jgi:hypothetical protein
MDCGLEPAHRSRTIRWSTGVLIRAHPRDQWWGFRCCWWFEWAGRFPDPDLRLEAAATGQAIGLLALTLLRKCYGGAGVHFHGARASALAYIRY